MVDSEDNTLRYEQLLMYAAGCVVVFAIRSVYWMAGHPKQVKRIRKGAEAVYYQSTPTNTRRTASTGSN